MMEGRRGPVRVGLCEGCRFVQLILSDKGSVFHLCERSRTDPRFPKYPRLPVLACGGFVPARDTPAKSTDQ